LLGDPVGIDQLVDLFAVEAEVTAYADLGKLAGIDQPLQVVVWDLKQGGSLRSR
jgi:hypothetical protein